MTAAKLYHALCAVSYVASLMLISCCAARSDTNTAVRTGLDVLAEVVAPTSELTEAACDAREELVMNDVRKGHRSATDGEHALVPIRQKCDALRKLIDQIRELHHQAVLFVESGGIEDAQARLEEARTLLKRLSAQLLPGRNEP